MNRIALAAVILFSLVACAARGDEVRPGTVTATSLNVRKGPSTAEPVLFQLEKGARVAVLERRGDWLAVEVAEGGRRRRGWVHADFVRLDPPPPVEMPRTRDQKLAFVRDPARSVLDLLGEDGTRWRTFEWHENDYPGSPGGPHEDEARALARRLEDLLPTRRVNTGPHRLPFDFERIERQWVQVPGQERHRLHRAAAESFVKMREAAAADGVRLELVSAARTLEHQKRLAAANQNPDAVAQGTSTHNYGLAIDLAMSPGAGREFREVSTRPFSNPLGMRESPVHKWMFLFGAEHGWYAYHNEPWHWEYNPPGLAERFPE